MHDALYGPAGFFRREAPADHFRTSVHASEWFAQALGRLARAHGLRHVVDVGAGRGELLRALHRSDPDLGLIGVEVADRPADLPPAIAWTANVPAVTDALVIANEWLDNVPLDVAEVDAAGVPRIVEVDPTGAERTGPPVEGADLAWCERWWPLDRARPGQRAEIGLPRDDGWAGLVRRATASLLLAIDYGHLREERPPCGTLTGFRSGRPTVPVPDGSCDLTAHVAFDAVRAAGEAAGAVTVEFGTQQDALRALGISARRPPLARAGWDPLGYLTALSRAGEASELLAPDGLGGYRWLLQRVGRSSIVG